MTQATRFAWGCLGSPAWEPPETKRGSRYGTDAVCWLCGLDTDGRGWPRAQAISETFTNTTLAEAPASRTVCQPCTYFSSGESWKQYAAAHPDMGLKAVHPLSWRSYSHVFAAGFHACPSRAEWRQWLLAPPKPPFLFAISESGQKHTIFRAQVSYSDDAYSVQIEEDAVWVERAAFSGCLQAFELLYNLGFSKDSIVSGDYHPAQLLRVGPRVWREAELAITPWRQRHPHLMRLAHFCARRREETERKEAEPLSTALILNA